MTNPNETKMINASVKLQTGIVKCMTKISDKSEMFRRWAYLLVHTAQMLDPHGSSSLKSSQHGQELVEFIGMQ